MFNLTSSFRLMSLSNPQRISLMLSLVSGWVTSRAGSIMQTSLTSSTQFEFCSFPSFDKLLTQTSQHTSACSTFAITGKERKQYVGHSTPLLPGMISTVCNTESLFAGSVLDTYSSSFFCVLLSLQPGWSLELCFLRRIGLISKSCFSKQSVPLFIWPWCLIWGWYGKENLDASHS